MTDTITAEALAAAEAKAKTEGETAGFKAANDRLNKVVASEEYKGREALASALLGNASMSADEIVAALAAAPKAAPAAADEEATRKAAEDAARAEMKDALDQNANSNIDANNGGGKPLDAKAKAASVWDRANAKVGRVKPAA